MIKFRSASEIRKALLIGIPAGIAMFLLRNYFGFSKLECIPILALFFALYVVFNLENIKKEFKKKGV